MKKKALSVILAASMTAGIFSGAVVAKAEEPYNIQMQIPTWGNAPTELAQVEEAINAIIEPEINATVTLNPIAAWDLINESNRSLVAGEKIDLLCIFTFGQAMDNIATYTSKNMLRPLNELFETYGADAAECLGEEINLGYVADTLYAVPSKSILGTGEGFVARKDYIDEMGIEVDPDKYYTWDEIAEVFEAFKQQYGAGHYALSLFGTAGNDSFHQLYELDSLGGSDNTGVLLNAGLDGNMTVVDLFETDEYMEYCKLMHDWYNAGYINPDVSTVSDDVTSQLKSGNYLGTIGSLVPGSNTAMATNVGVDMVTFKTVEPYAGTTFASQALWAIPNTSENPEKVMEFLNLLYQERDLASDIDSLLTAGLEGVSYNVVEEVDGSKAIVEQADGDWSMWVPSEPYGNYFTIPRYVPNEASIYDELQQFNDKILEDGRITDAFGYVFDTTPVSPQVAAVTSVAAQYRGMVGYGAMDPEDIMPEFIEALKDAGIDDIIEENQRQLDEWLASR